MSKIADQLIYWEEEYEKAKREFTYWYGQMQSWGWNHNTAIAAAQYYGRMWAFASIAKELGDERWIDDLNSMKIRLYEHDWKGL